MRIARRFLPFPQPLGLGAALLEVQLWLLGKLLAVALPGGQLQLLELLLGAVSLTKSNQGLTAAAVRRDAALARQRYANCVAVAVVGLAGLAPVAKRVRAGAEPQDKVSGQWRVCVLGVEGAWGHDWEALHVQGEWPMEGSGPMHTTACCCCCCMCC